MDREPMVAILGRTRPEARYWKHRFVDRFPDLADARELSTFSVQSMQGLLIDRAYIAPAAYAGRDYNACMDTLRWCLRKRPGADGDVIYLEEGK